MLNKGEQARIVADSYNKDTRTRLTTFLIELPKYLVAQNNTHRVFSRNCASSRAIPVSKVIQSVRDNPVTERFTKNQRGMVGLDAFTEDELLEIEVYWDCLKYDTLEAAEWLAEKGVHKQHVNRILEAYMNAEVLVSSTEWDNFFDLRENHATQPLFQEVAVKMHGLLNQSDPHRLLPGEWHIPFSDLIDLDLPLEIKLKICIARYARLSYNSHDGNHTIQKDLDLYDSLLAEKHFSCFEHCAVAVESCNNYLPEYPVISKNITKFLFPLPIDSFILSEAEEHRLEFSRNYAGFYSYRAQLEDQYLTFL